MEEFKSLEDEFVSFLVVNGIDADTWAKMKKKQGQKAEKIMNSFSQVVFEKIYRNAAYLYKIEKDAVFCFYFKEKEAQMIGFQFENSNHLDLGSIDIYRTFQNELIKKASLVSQTKNYLKKREFEMDDLIKGGCELGDASLFDVVKSTLFSDK